MRRRWQPYVAFLGSTLLAVTILGCIGNPEPPPVPTQTRVPTVVGRLVGPTPDRFGFLLEDGTSVDLGLSGSDVPRAERLSANDVQLPDRDRPGGLLLFGEDAGGRFYAATTPHDQFSCDILRGQGYIERDRVHLSTGLVVPFAPDMSRINDRDPKYNDPTWLLDFDLICLDEDGRVTLIRQLPLGA